MRGKDSFGAEVLSGESSISEFQEALISWFRKNGKRFPWRLTNDPYAILVSESMLQQTRIATVLERRYFERWMERFPTMEALASAEESEILKTWEGLGYYNRARNLQKAAKAVCDKHGGEFPRDETAIRALPGVGPYTAGAVLSFAFDRRGVIVDGNVSRVLSRVFAFPESVDSSGGVKKIWEFADRLTPENRVRFYNSAIMELGQRVCSKNRPRCLVCPVSKWCSAFHRGIAEDFPVKKAKRKATRKVERVALFVRGGKIFLTREEGSRRKGLWRLPELSEADASDLEESFRFDYSITRFRVTLVVHVLRGPMAGQSGGSGRGEWFSLGETDRWPALGSPYRRAILEFQDLGEA